MRRSLSEADVKNAFEVFAELMANGTSLEQLETAETMVFFISNYLRQCMPDINLAGLLILGEELSDIGNKKKPTFIKAKDNKPGRPIALGEQLRFACIAAAVEILVAEKIKVADAMSMVAAISGLKTSRVKQLRKEFREGKRSDKATQFMHDRVRDAASSDLPAIIKVEALSSLIVKKGENT